MFIGLQLLGKPGRLACHCLAGAVLCSIALLPGRAWAADKSGVSLQAVTLPDGPGSIRGLGNEFEPDLPNGTASFAVPMPVMKGTNDQAPELILEYDAGNENGIAGFGWDLGLPYVQRRDARPLPRYTDGPGSIDPWLVGIESPPDFGDRFVTDEHGEPEGLVRREDGYYFGEKEGPFIRYERVDAHWVGTHPDGSTMAFGVTANGRIEDGTGKVFRWNIEEEQDTYGNTIRYVYESFPGAQNLNQKYLVRIEYGAGPPPWDNFHMIVFSYEDRPDWFESGRAGFLVRTGKRLSRIEMATQGPVLPGHEAGDYNGDGVTAYLNRRYLLSYEADPHWSLLTTITEYGADGVSTLPTLSMEYTRCSDETEVSALDHYIATENTPVVLFDRDYVEITDLNGDALPDLIKTDPLGGAHIAYLNLGEVEEDGVRKVAFSDGILMGGDERVYSVNLSEDAGAPAYLSDMNGNGRSDLVYTASPYEVYYFPSEVSAGQPQWGPRRNMNPVLDRAAPPSPFDGVNAEHGDLNGDDLSDVFQSISVGGLTSIRVWLNEDGDRYAPFYTVAQDFSFQLGDAGVEVVDINGDGLIDLVQVKEGSILVAAGLGYGRFAPLVTIPMPELLGLPGEISFEDINGNGLDDLVQLWPQPGIMRYFLNLGNYQFAPARVITDIPARLSSDAAIRVADLNGNGSADLIYADRLAEPRVQAIDLGACLGCLPAANMLKRVDNGIGRSMTMRYATTTQFLLADRAAGNAWEDPLPIVVPVVAEIIVEDGLGNLYNNLYTYHDGVYNTEYRMFVGFGRVATEEVGDTSAPSRIDRYSFDMGRDLFLLRGNTLNQRVESLDGDVFQEEIFEYTVDELFTGVEGIPSRNVYESVHEKHILEKGVGTPRIIRTERTQDAFGNEIELKEWGVYDENDPLAFNDERITRMDYARNIDKWILRHPARIQIYDGAENLVNKSEFFYDDETWSGENFGEVIRGGQTMEVGYYDVSEEDAIFFSDRVRYDAYGNVILELDELAEVIDGELDEGPGHYRRYTYDSLFHTFPEGEEVGVGGDKDPILVQVAYNYGLGTVLESYDFSGNRTSYSYDAFGRLSASMRPGDQEGFPSLEYIYAQAVPYKNGLINYVETRVLDTEPGDSDERLDYYALSRTYVDGMGRTLGTWDEAEPDPVNGAPRVAVTEAVGFHGRGEVSFTLQPHFLVRPGASLHNLLDYKSIWEDDWEGLFQTEAGLEALGLDEAPGKTTVFDELLRELRETYGDGTWREQRYEPLVVIRLDENDVDPDSPFFDTPVIHHSDGLGRLIQVDEVVRLDAQGEATAEKDVWSTYYTYRCDGVLLSMEDAMGNVRRYEYDAVQTLYFIDDPNRGHRHFELDDVGNVIMITDAAGRETLLTYDGVNRLVTVDYLDEDEDYSFGFSYDPEEPISAENRPDIYYGYDVPFGPVDGGDGTEVIAANTAGQLSYVVYPTGEYHYSYTPRQGQAWTVHRMRDPLSGALISFKTEMENDPAGRVQTLRYPDNDVVHFSYTARGLMGEVKGGASLHPGGQNYFLRGTSYGPGGERLEALYGNGMKASYRYDRRERLSEIVAAPQADPEAPLLAFAYTYDPTSNITAIMDNRPNASVPAEDPRRNTQRFRYDDRDRLIEATYFQAQADGAGDPDGLIQYRFDPVGNMISMDSTIEQSTRGYSVTQLGVLEYGGDGGATQRDGREEGDPPGPQALTRAYTEDGERLYEYDDMGNLIAGDGFTLVWDFEQRLAFIEDDTMRAEYWYDHSGLRSTKQVWKKDENGEMAADPDSVVFYVGEHFEVREYDQITKYVVEDSGRIAKITGALDDSAQLVQRFRIESGWNFLSLAVDAPDAVAQLSACEVCAIEGLFLFDPSDDSYTEVGEGDTLPVGSLFWLYAETGFLSTVTGAVSENAGGLVSSQDGFISFAGYDALPLADVLPEETETAWLWNGRSGQWEARLEGDLAFLSDAPDFVRPGQAVFVRLAAPGDFSLPPPSSRVQYYHKDHLNSSSIIADGAGDVVEEIAYYPYGEPRLELRRSDNALPNPYQFAEKERDQESKLSYFSARYLAPSLGRFLSADPLADDFPDDYLADPQLQHAYSFARSNPLVYSDPTGRIIETSRASKKAKNLNPFGKTQLRKGGVTKAEKFASVFGGMNLKKGDTLPSGPGLKGVKVSKRVMKELDKDVDKLTDPKTFIANIAQTAEDMKNTLPQSGKGKVDVDQFLNLFTKERAFGPLEKDTQLTKGGREIISESAFDKKFDLSGFDKVLDSIGNLEDKYNELKGVADKALQKQEFKFDTKQAADFAKKYLNETDLDPPGDDDKNDDEDE